LYSSGVEAAEKTGFDYSSIMACAKGVYKNHKTCGKHIWKYVDNVVLLNYLNTEK
jgi:hypothetical protein